jgi:hypothetical protein
MDPMTHDQAFSWLTSGQSPAGTLVSNTRARRLMSWARDVGAVHMTKGPDLAAPGHLLTFDHDTERYEAVAAGQAAGA